MIVMEKREKDGIDSKKKHLLFFSFKKNQFHRNENL